MCDNTNGRLTYVVLGGSYNFYFYFYSHIGWTLFGYFLAKLNSYWSQRTGLNRPQSPLSHSGPRAVTYFDIGSTVPERNTSDGPKGFTWPPNHGTIRVKCLTKGHKKRHTNFWHQLDSNPRRGVIHVFRVWCSIHCITLPS